MGLMNALGLPFDEVFDAIHQANMNKCVDGQVIRRADGKILKPDGWKPANVLDLLKKHLES
jgi:predicted HAD superfamily Cof-like phosphohydrolase